jgi:hypothetical protein
LTGEDVAMLRFADRLNWESSRSGMLEEWPEHRMGRDSRVLFNEFLDDNNGVGLIRDRPDVVVLA